MEAARGVEGWASTSRLGSHRSAVASVSLRAHVQGVRSARRFSLGLGRTAISGAEMWMGGVLRQRNSRVSPQASTHAPGGFGSSA